MNVLLWIILATVLGGVLSALAASLFLLVPEHKRVHWIPHLVSFAIGALLAAALLDLLPEAISTAGVSRASQVGLTLLVGVLIFFVLEKLVLWRHCHYNTCEAHPVDEHHPQETHHSYAHARPHVHEVQEQHRHAASGWMILFGDGLHNMLDGVLIAAAFMTDIHLGIVTSLAVIVHEIPQEVGDLAILLHGGMSRRKALLLNLITSLTSVIGAVIAFFALGTAMQVLPYAITLAAASFIYIAVADLIPGLHRRVDPESAIQQFALISSGVLLIGVMEHLLRA
ncbi:MAG TPA: ZIP family metal transporter [Steroidobacteraceae bacterium]|nr:ZIP family metal transporter [Steroidobacteraceae bacterium]